MGGLGAESWKETEGAREGLAGRGMEAAGGLCKHSGSCWQREVEPGAPTRVCGWKMGCHVPSSQEGRQLPITQTAVQDGMEISPEQGS